MAPHPSRDSALRAIYEKDYPTGSGILDSDQEKVDCWKENLLAIRASAEENPILPGFKLLESVYISLQPEVRLTGRFTPVFASRQQQSTVTLRERLVDHGPEDVVHS